MEMFEQVVPGEAAGQRLDVFAANVAGITRSRLAQLVAEGRVFVNERAASKAGLKLTAGERVRVEIPPLKPATVKAEALPLSILYQDADVAVVYKPAGMVVHPAAGNESGTLVHALLYHMRDLSGIGGVLRPGIVHRLDKDTSGVLLIAKHDAAHQALSAQLKARTMEKIYAALVLGTPKPERGRIDAPIARDPKDRKKMAVVPDGREATTLYQVTGSWPGVSLLKLRILTGRTHQIRVHLRSLGHPLLGDPLYGTRRPTLTVPRLMLHAYSLAFDQPSTGERLRITAPFPADFLLPLQKLCRQADAAGAEEALQAALQPFDEPFVQTDLG